MRPFARFLLVALLAVVALVTLVPAAPAAVAAVVQDAPTLPPEIPTAYLALVGVLTSVVFGVVKFFSAKVRALPDWAKMGLALVVPFAWKFAVAAAAGVGIPLPETIGGLEDLGVLSLSVGGVLAMGIRAAFKALFPKLSAATSG